jgi:hypothetical protein
MKMDPTAGADFAAQRLKNSRRALQAALEHIQMIQREAQHRRGYAAHPVGEKEFSGWTSEQVWPD